MSKSLITLHQDFELRVPTIPIVPGAAPLLILGNDLLAPFGKNYSFKGFKVSHNEVFLKLLDKARDRQIYVKCEYVPPR